MNEIKSTEEWFVKAGQMPEQPKPDVRQAAFYMGMQLEEIAEKLGVVLGGNDTGVEWIEVLASWFKDGIYDFQIQKALNLDPELLLDADMDLLWVTVGAARAQGANVEGAYGEVTRANYDKFPGGVVTKDANGKVVKPEGWRGPDLLPFVYPA